MRLMNYVQLLHQRRCKCDSSLGTETSFIQGHVKELLKRTKTRYVRAVSVETDNQI